MKRTQWLQETRMMQFEGTYFGWSEDRLTQREAARLLGVTGYLYLKRQKILENGSIVLE